MKDTKAKIITTSIHLLNQEGFANFNLQKIATTLNISLGNLTYHFPKKDQLMRRIYDQFKEDLAIITKEYQPLVDLVGIDQQLRAFYKFQQQYRFFYLNLLELERAYPFIAEEHHPYVEGHIKGIYNYFLFNIGSGMMQAVDDLKIYEQLAHQFWMTIVFWHMQLAFRGKKGTEDEMLTAVWALLMPYLTEKGKSVVENLINNTTEVRSQTA